MAAERKHYAPEEKVAVVERHPVERVPVSDPCDELDLKRTRFLLLDSRVIESAENARLALGKPVKSPHNPLMAKDEPWERRFDNLYANVVYDEEDQLYKCWYSPFIVDHSARGMTLDQRRKTPCRPPSGRAYPERVQRGAAEPRKSPSPRGEPATAPGS